MDEEQIMEETDDGYGWGDGEGIGGGVVRPAAI